MFDIVSDDPTDRRLREVFEKVRGFGMTEVPNLYRTIALSPTMLAAWVEFAWTLRRETETPRALRELMILRSAQVSGTDYEWVHHVPMALEAGVSSRQIDALSDWRASDLFDPKERAALEVSEQITRGPGASAEAMAALAEFFGPQELMELVLTISLYPCVSRIINTMGVEIEDSFRHLVPGTAKAG